MKHNLKDSFKGGPLILSCGLALALAQGAVARPDLHNNGPFVTNAGGGAGGADLSAVQLQLANLTHGVSMQQSPLADRVADDFTLSTSSTLTSVVLYSFQRNSSTTVSPFTSVNLRIWSGRPGDPGSQILFGDTTTNRLTSAAWTGSYRAHNDIPTNTERPIFAVQAAISPALALPAGTYWIDWQMAGTLSSGPSAAVVTLLNQVGPANANARWKGGTMTNWIDAVDGGASQAPLELAFIIRGTTGGQTPCYPNCDGSTAAPVLTANDFQCFLNSFASVASYANCDGSTAAPLLTANDFQCFLNRFASGCT